MRYWWYRTSDNKERHFSVVFIRQPKKLVPVPAESWEELCCCFVDWRKAQFKNFIERSLDILFSLCSRARTVYV